MFIFSFFFFFKQKTAYEMRISDCSSDVCSSDLFASPNWLYNLSQLSVWWLSLGIEIERIKPGQPQQNGRHERMHLTLKKETTRPPRANILQQQARFDDFVSEFNGERPHDALAMKTPVEVYHLPSTPSNGLPATARKSVEKGKGA